MFDKDTKSTFRLIFFILLTLFLIKVFDLSYPVALTTSSRSSELAVTGEGKVDVVPDTAHVDVGISVRGASSVNDAQNEINSVNNRVVAALTKLGVKKTDIKTSNYSIYPNVVYKDNQDSVSGYNGNVTINIKTRNIQLVSEIIETATAAGANEVQSTRFSVEDPGRAREEARNKAIANAREQAQKLAKTLGIRLGKIVNVVESSRDLGGPIYPLSAREGELGIGGGGPPEIQPGSQTVTSIVTLYFEKR